MSAGNKNEALKTQSKEDLVFDPRVISECPEEEGIVNMCLNGQYLNAIKHLVWIINILP